MRKLTSAVRYCGTVLTVVFIGAVLALGQEVRVPEQEPTNAAKNAEEVAEILGVAALVDRLHSAHEARGCSGAATLEEMALRQEIYERTFAASLDVDSVVAEINSERAQLSELRSALQNRRDRAVGLMNVANLITGTGVGIAVNAMQLSDTTATAGDYVGIGSGVGSTVLSIIGIRLQRGPHGIVGSVPNMLAPLLGRESVLNTYYPKEVMNYLNGMPAGAAAKRSRLELLKEAWVQAGRLEVEASPKAERKVTALTSSMNQKVKLSIDDVTDRMAMLNDVSGRVELMKRDLAGLLRGLQSSATCH